VSGRFLYIFSTKALIYTAIGAAVGGLFYLLFNAIGLSTLAFIIVVLFALIGFVIGTFKMPNIETFKISRKTGGENLDDILKRYVLFKRKKSKIFVYTREEKIDVNK